MAREKIDNQLNDAGWGVVDRNDYVPFHSLAVRESLMQGGKESDYLFYIDNKAIAILEAKREENQLKHDVEEQAEEYAAKPISWIKTWIPNQIPLVYLSNGKKILFKNLLDKNSDYIELKEMDSPKDMLRKIRMNSKFGKLPLISKKGLRDCQFDALTELEEGIRRGDKRFLAILATGAGKTYLASLAAYRQLEYTDTRRVLFLVDRNNLGKQAAVEFSQFSRTRNNQELNKIYDIRRLRKNEDITGTIVISTIQKLYTLMTGATLSDDNEDEEDELNMLKEEASNSQAVVLDGNIMLPPDYFQFIIVDECHRSIYNKWSAVLKYFSNATILGLTATPTPEAYAFFNNNIVENYTYDKSVVDGVNVPYDVYITKTNITEHGGAIQIGEKYSEVTRTSGTEEIIDSHIRYDYRPSQLDRDVTAEKQIETVVSIFRDKIYTELYPERNPLWEYIPKTLIFAKNDHHATEILESCERVFGEKFPGGIVPEGFAQKITYTAGDSDMLIQEFRTKKQFRIAITVTLVSTGTDIKPLEIVMFMSDVRSSVLYEQMKGRGCRTISDSMLRDVTPNADTKSRFIVYDAVGVTSSDKSIKTRDYEPGEMKLSLEQLLERLAHGELTDKNLFLLSDYCSSINQRYEFNMLLNHHLEEYEKSFGFIPKVIAAAITEGFESHSIPEYEENGANDIRLELIKPLIFDIKARKKLLELKAGYEIKSSMEDYEIYSGFDTEKVKSHIEKFESFINDHADDIEALRIIYNSDFPITMSMLKDLQQKLLDEDRQFTAPRLWSWYRMLDENKAVSSTGKEPDCLANLIQLVRYGFKMSAQLSSLSTYANSRFNLYEGQIQNTLTQDQLHLMRKISEYVVYSGVISTKEFYGIDADIWRELLQLFGNIDNADKKIIQMSSFILKAV